MSIASWTSPSASGRTLPISRVTSLLRAVFRRVSCSASAKRISPRRGAGMCAQAGKAARAALTASSTSVMVESGATATVSSFCAGLRLMKVRFDRLSTHRPLMKFFRCSAMDNRILLY